MIEKIKKITIVLVSYNSSKKIKKFIKKLPTTTPIMIVDNSNDTSLIKDFKRKKNIKIFFKKNLGYGSSINFAAKRIKTPYFFVIQPDVTGINKSALLKFYDYAKKMRDKFSVMGPHFLDAPKKGHYQTSLEHKIKRIHNVHGSTIFFNKKVFKKNQGFDENIFLYWEETDYTKRALRNGFSAYQLNIVKVRHEKGKAVEVKNQEDREKLSNLYSWHFIWSKFYYFKKHYGKILAIIYFLPIIARTFLRVTIYRITNNNKFIKYNCRWDGLKSSILDRKSSMRLANIPVKL